MSLGFVSIYINTPPPSLQQSNLLYLYFIFIFVFMSLGFVSFYIICLVGGFITRGLGSLGFDPTGLLSREYVTHWVFGLLGLMPGGFYILRLCSEGII